MDCLTVSCLRFLENLALNLTFRTFRSQKSTDNLNRKSIDWMRKGGNGHVGNSQRPTWETHLQIFAIFEHIGALLDNVFVFRNSLIHVTDKFSKFVQLVCLVVCKSTYLQSCLHLFLCESRWDSDLQRKSFRHCLKGPVWRAADSGALSWIWD